MHISPKPFGLLSPKAFPFILFNTNKNGIFAPTITTLDGSIATWKVEGFGEQITNTPSFDLTGNLSILEVELSIKSFAEVDELSVDDEDIVGGLDLIDFTGLVSLVGNTNLLLTSVVLPASTALIERILLYDNDLSSLDASGLSNLGGQFFCAIMPNLTSISNPTSSRPITVYTARNNPVLTTLDVSGLTGLGGIFHCFDSPGLLSLTLPTTSEIFTEFKAFNCNLSSVDLSTLAGLGGMLDLHGNTNLSSVTNSASTQIYTDYLVYDCALTSLDLSGVIGLRNNFSAENNSLTSIINPTTSAVFIQYLINDNNLTTLDLSTLTGLGGNINFSGNNNMTSVSNPVSSQAITIYSAHSCNLSALDVSGLTGLAGVFLAYGNANLTSITNPVSSGVFSQYLAIDCNLSYVDFTTMPNMLDKNSMLLWLYNNSMTSGEVDSILIDLDSIADGLYTGRQISIGGTNAAPTAASLAARNSLIAKGFALTTS